MDARLWPNLVPTGEVTMKSVKTAAILAASMLAMVATTAQATVYIGTRTLGTFAVNLSITTDGTLGTLARANITDWNIVVTATNPVNNSLFTSSNSIAEVSGTALSATASDLTFNFDSAQLSYVLFYNFPIPGISTHSYCVETASRNRCNIVVPGPHEAVYDVADPFGHGSFALQREGIGLLGTASIVSSGVPEPASWALMIAGFGMVGAALRRRQRQTARVTYA
jgi:hypothetical protein